MSTLVPIVEGDGEVQALPVLLRRLALWRPALESMIVAMPIRVRRDRFVNRDDEFRRFLGLARFKALAAGGGAVLVVLDADDDCPAKLGSELTTKAMKVFPDLRIQVVLANREYEAWFIASATSLQGVRGFGARADDGGTDAEVPRNAKGWIAERILAGGYSPVKDQAAFSGKMDLDLAHANSRSFRKLVTACHALL